MGYSYETATKVLSESEKNRMICAFLNTDQSSINWDKATKAFGAASVESMRRCVYNSLKKIENAGGKDDSEATRTKATPTKSGGKKRKATDDGDDVEDTPTKKKGRKPKAAASAPTKDEVKVKDEGDDGED